MDFPSCFFIIAEGSKFCFRPIHPSDKALLQQGFSKLSEKSRYLRFFYTLRRLSNAHLRYLTHVDDDQHVAWGILDESGEEPIPVGLGRFVRLKNEQEVAEIAITVVDSYQRKGLGNLLFATLSIIAAQKGVKVFRYHVHDTNRFVLHVLKQFETLNHKHEDQVTTVDIKVIPNHQAISDHPNMTRFKTSMTRIEKAVGMEVKD